MVTARQGWAVSLIIDLTAAEARVQALGVLPGLLVATSVQVWCKLLWKMTHLFILPSLMVFQMKAREVEQETHKPIMTQEFF